MNEGDHNTTRQRGEEAEQLAADYLTRQGLQVVQRNFRVRGGEIDLICREGRTLVFVEVRLRTHRAFGGARDSIGYGKQQRILMAARHYLARCAGDWACRFDVVLLADLHRESIEWIRDAFDVD